LYDQQEAVSFPCMLAQLSTNPRTLSQPAGDVECNLQCLLRVQSRVAVRVVAAVQVLLLSGSDSKAGRATHVG
jgi:hypothetical protein